MEAIPPLDVREVSAILGRLEEVVADPRVVLVGGQAVSVWFEQLADRLGDAATGMEVLSGDLDLLGTAATAREAATLLGARLRLSTWEDRTTLAGVALFLDGDGVERRLDVMHSIHGMRSDDIRDTAIEAEVDLDDRQPIPVWLMHPERVMESRVHNSSLPNKQTELAGRQLRASILCARAFSQLLLDERGAVRDVLNLNERVFRFALRDSDARRIALSDGIECLDAVLADDRLGEPFLARRYPQMQAQIRTVRGRDRAQRPTGR